MHLDGCIEVEAAYYSLPPAGSASSSKFNGMPSTSVSSIPQPISLCASISGRYSNTWWGLVAAAAATTYCYSMATAKQATQAPQEEEQESVNSVLDEEAGVAPRRYFTIPGRDPFDEIEWETRDALIPGKSGPAFEQRDVEFPKFWSQTATNIVAQKYFRGRMASPERERSVKQMIGRVADTATAWGKQGGYFASDEEAETFHAELKAILVNQYASFNSPVWFNVGFEETPQCSACFILSIDDSMESILDWIRREGIIFRGGSGLGPQPVAAALVEGAALEGRLRVRPGVVHARRGRVGGDDQVGRQDPARREDGRARRRPPGRRGVHLVQGARGAQGARPRAGGLRHVARLARLGLDPVPEREQLGARHGRLHGGGHRGQGVGAHRAHRRHGRRDDRRARLLRDIAAAAWECADPGVQYDTTINAWHTSPNTGRINASNPC